MNDMALNDWLTLLAIVLGPVIAVLLAQKIQKNREESDRIYQHKLSVFAAIIGLRHSKGYDEQFIIAINQIPIVFKDNKDVLAYLETFINKHQDTAIDDSVEKLNKLDSYLNDLTKSIAEDLGYNNIDNAVMDSFFNPNASFYRRLSSGVYNEKYYLENVASLLSLRENKGSKNQ